MLAQAALLLLAAPTLGGSRAWGTPPLQPATCRSPSGEWTLEVDPSSRFGAGAADYRASRSGELVWAKRLAFTLREACIDDRGFVAGYAYDQGQNSVASVGNFLIAVLSPVGEVLGQHAWPMQSGFGIHSSPEPWVRELVLDPHHGAVLFRIETHDRNASYEEWRIADLESGRLIDCYRPDQRCGFPAERRASVIDVLPIPGTALWAVCWRISIAPEDSSAKDMCLNVVGLDGTVVASLDLPQELDVSADSRTGMSPWRKVWSFGTLLPAHEEGRFAVWLPRSGVRVDMRLAQGPDEFAWRIAALGNEPYEPAEQAPPADPPVEEVELALLARTELQAESAPEPGPIRDIVAFGFDGPGRLQAVRLDDGQRSLFTCLVLDEQGNVLLERQLDPLDAGEPERREWWPLGRSRWLVTPDSLSNSWNLDAFLVDSSTGVLERGQCQGFTQIDAVAAAPDGGFVVLGSTYGVGQCLSQFDSSGSPRWFANLEGSLEAPTRLNSADDVAVSPSGLVAVVDPWKDAIGLFGSDGTLAARLELAELWEHDPSYVADIEADGDKGFLVVERPSAPIVRRVGLDGRIHASLVPRHPDGSKDSWLAGNVRRAPDGRLWTTDRSALLRLDEEGLADLVLGQARVVETLDAPWNAAIDPLGRVAILDADTRALHVFDRTGTALFVAASDAGDFEGNSSEGDLAASFEGGLFVSSAVLPGGWLAFDSQGTRLGSIDLKGQSTYRSLEVAFAPEPGTFWLERLEDHEAAVLRDHEQRELARIDRRLDRRWFEQLDGLAVAPSGRVAVLEGLGFSGGGSALSWFDGAGRPIDQVALPRSFPGHVLAFSGAWIAVASYEVDGVVLCRISDGTLMHWNPPAAWSASRGGIVGFAPEGREVWLVQASDRALWRFALP